LKISNKRDLHPLIKRERVFLKDKNSKNFIQDV